jgi:hypothetical protein
MFVARIPGADPDIPFDEFMLDPGVVSLRPRLK